jgi:proteasome assembly chaperone (PAC2) family protein
MSVFKTDETSLEKRVKVLEKKVRQLEALLGKKPTKESDEKNVKQEEEDFCIIT